MAMASDRRSHFSDPYHQLQKTKYSHAQTGLCSICLLELANHKGYGCYSCNIHVHTACAGYFRETISFFAHPAHTLKLSRSPGRICNICRGDCPQGSFVYRCIGCGFDVHPLCSMLPERAASPFHPGHDLSMVSSSSLGSCSACYHPLPLWRYICGSSRQQLHVMCAIAAGGKGSNVPAAPFKDSYGGAEGGHGGAAGQRGLGGPAGQGWYGAPVTAPAYNLGGGPAGQGWYGTPVTAPAYNLGGGPAVQGWYGPVTAAPAYNYNHGIQGYGSPVIQGGYGHPPIQYGGYNYSYVVPVMPGGSSATGTSGQSILHSPTRLMTAIAKFLVGAAFSAAASDLASGILSGSFN